MKNHVESEMMSYGYDPSEHHGSVKPPLYLTSTFALEKAEHGTESFGPGKTVDRFVYSRLDNPTLRLAEERLKLWDDAEDCALFESGMAAISTALMALLRPGDVIAYTNPLYSGTDALLQQVLRPFGIVTIAIEQGETADALKARLISEHLWERLRVVYVETPANPTNFQHDLEDYVKLVHERRMQGYEAWTFADNTYLGPVWEHPLSKGADVVLYSATKSITGHSDIIAGAACGAKTLIGRIKNMRQFLGGTASPHTSWMVLRSLETLLLRSQKQQENAQHIAHWLTAHTSVDFLHYPGKGGMIAFGIKGEMRDTLRFLNGFKLIHLSVSLGSNESLIQHPYTMTHAGVSKLEKERYGITPQLVRLSVGIENIDDLLADIQRALGQISGEQ
jgi:methionine-gamma-lyase